MSRRFTPSYTEYLKLMSSSEEPLYEDFSYYIRENPLLNAFLNSTPHVVYVFDYRQRNYPFISRNMLQLTGYAAEAVQEGGVEFYLDVYQKDDLKIFSEHIFKANANFLSGIAPGERNRYRMSHCYRMRSKSNDYVHLLQHNTFMRTDAKGTPVISMGTVMDISPFKTDTKITHRIDLIENSGAASNVVSNYFFPDAEQGLLTKREKEVLKWILEGLNSQAIAHKLYLSLHTVKTHRKHILVKTNAKNMADLIKYALSSGII